MKKFKVISWHGPSNNINENSKKEILKELIEFCEHKYSDLPILIGGDFNLNISEAQNIIQGKRGWCIPISEGNDPEDRKAYIDYFIVYKLKLEKISYESLKFESSNRIFSQIDGEKIVEIRNDFSEAIKALNETKNQLKLRCRNLGLKVSARRKSELVERISQHYLKELSSKGHDLDDPNVNFNKILPEKILDHSPHLAVLDLGNFAPFTISSLSLSDGD